jgi:hypothetical protein
MTTNRPSEIEVMPRDFTENGCEVVAIVADPAGSQQTLYGTVTRNGVLIGSYYCLDRAHQSDWRLVTTLGVPLTLEGNQLNPISEAAAVAVLTTISTFRDTDEVEQWLRKVTRAPQ